MTNCLPQCDTPQIDAVWHGIRDASIRLSAPNWKPVSPQGDAGFQFGAGIGPHLHVPRAPMIGVEDPRDIRLAVTRLASDRELAERTLPVHRDPFFTVQVYQRPATGAQLWLAEKPQAADPARHPGGVPTREDVEREPAVYLGRAFDIVQFYLSRGALDEFTDQHGLRRCEGPFWPTGRVDPDFLQLALSILPAFQHPEENPRIYLDHLVLAAYAYIARHYARLVVPTAVRGGLAPWQQRRATEMLRANLDGRVALADIARECELSPSRFAHAFKKSFGHPPHQWLTEQRLLAAKDLLLHSRRSIVEVALSCGFHDQSAFFRAFKKNLGISPDQWRRNQKT